MRILIVDDSIVYRSQIRIALDGQEGIDYVDSTLNGKLALEKLEQGSFDVMILDLEMPILSGLDTLREMRKRGFITKVLVFSALSRNGAEATLQALSLGADDFALKPSEGQVNFDTAPIKIREAILPKLAILLQSIKEPAVSPRSVDARVEKATELPTSTVDLSKHRPAVIVIGSSTGGPMALERIFADLNGFQLRCPILVTQHMPPVFTATLASRIEKLTGITCTEAQNFEPLRNRIYVAPGDYHMELKTHDSRVVLALNQSPPRNSVRPAVDPLFESAARVFGTSVVGFVLTGMGSDGAIGAKVIRDQGGSIVIQNRESCVVFGMPGAVFQSKQYDEILDLESIARRLVLLATLVDRTVASPRG